MEKLFSCEEKRQTKSATVCWMIHRKLEKRTRDENLQRFMTQRKYLKSTDILRWDHPNSSKLSTNKELRNSINAMSFSFVLFFCGEQKYFTKMRENVFNQSKQEWSTSASLAWRHKLVQWFRVIFFHSLFRARAIEYEATFIAKIPHAFLAVLSFPLHT